VERRFTRIIASKQERIVVSLVFNSTRGESSKITEAELKVLDGCICRFRCFSWNSQAITEFLKLIIQETFAAGFTEEIGYISFREKSNKYTVDCAFNN
jgi:hypothetical protein